MLTLEDLPDEILAIIFYHLSDFEDQIDFALVMRRTLQIFVNSNGTIPVNIRTYSKYYTGILTNLIIDYGFSVKETRILNSRAVSLFHPDIFANHDFKHINLSGLKSEDFYVKIITDKLCFGQNKVFNLEFEYSLNDKLGTLDYYLSNITDISTDDYYQLQRVLIYDVPWYTTRLHFEKESKLVTNLDKISKYNNPILVPKDKLILYCEVNDYVIAKNCIDPKTNYEEWVSALTKSYKHLNNIYISKSFCSSNTKNNMVTVANYTYWNDPIKLLELTTIMISLIIIMVIIVAIFVTIYIIGKVEIIMSSIPLSSCRSSF